MSKDNVLHWLTSDRSLTKAKEIYNTLPGKSLSVQHRLNMLPDNKKSLEYIAYEMCKLVGLPEGATRSMLSKPMVAIAKTDAPVKTTAPQSIEDRILVLDISTLEWLDIKALAKELKEKLDAPIKGRSKEDLTASINTFLTDYRTKQLESIPQDVRATIRMRDQFPFLSEKDCPDVLKVLVNDLITAYHTYREAHGKLFDTMTQDERAAIAATVKDNYIANKQAWDELDHYKSNGNLLGAHPTVELHVEQEEIKQLNANALSKKKGALAARKTRAKKALEDMKEGTPEFIAAEIKLSLVTSLLTVVEEELAKR